MEDKIEIKKERRIYYGIKTRCYNKKNKGYKNYGGRGIIMCDRWLNSFKNFLKDMGEMPDLDHSIERIDINGNYEPSNCKWIPREEQNWNTSASVFVEYLGKKYCIGELAKKMNISYPTLYFRIKEGLTPEEAINWKKGNQIKSERKPCVKKGEVHKKSKLTKEQILDIYYSTDRRIIIAEKYNISDGTVDYIKTKKSHKSILEDL